MSHPCIDPVCILKEHPFSNWKDENKHRLLTSSKPTPVIDSFKEGNRRAFRPEWYNEFEWLCGSFCKQRLFCWWCILQSSDNLTWCDKGFTDTNNATRGFRMHANSVDHMKCAVGFKFLIKKFVQKPIQNVSVLDKVKHNDTVRINRRIMTMLFKVTVLLASQELPFRGHDDSETLENGGNFNKIINKWVSQSSTEIQEQFEKFKSVLTCGSNAIENEFIACVAEYLKDLVLKEVTKSRILSFHVDDTTYLKQVAQFSIVLRFVNDDGRIVERFFGFYNVEDKTSYGIFNLLHSVLTPLNYEKKLVAQCYDGASLKRGDLSSLQRRVNLSSTALFVHCIAHQIDLVLEQAVGLSDEGRIFFSDINGLPEFLHYCSKRTSILNLIPEVKRTITTDLPSSSLLILMIANNYVAMKEICKEIIDDPKTDLSMLRKARGYLAALNSFLFAFMLLIFQKVYELTDDLWQILRSDCYNVPRCIESLKTTINELSILRSETVALELAKKAGEMASKAPDDMSFSADDVCEPQRILYDVIDIVKHQLDLRFQDIHKLTFVTLVDSSQFEKFCSEFPMKALENLLVSFDEIFTETQLRVQLFILYSDMEYRNLTVQDTILKLKDNDVHEILDEVYLLLCLVSTLPSTIVSMEKDPSFVKRIKTAAKNITTEKKLSDLAMISIQKDLLIQLKEQDSRFYDKLINTYAGKKECRLELNFIDK